MLKSKKHRMDELMKRKNLNSVELLRKIYDMLSPDKRQGRYDFAEKNKGNFSKMLNGERSFPYKYVVPLERILGTTMDYIETGEEPANGIQLRKKGIEYTAHCNLYDAYVRLGAETDSEGRPIIGNYDEYNKNLLDYIIEYQSEQGLLFLHEHFGFVYELMSKAFHCTSPSGSSPSFHAYDRDKQLMLVKLLVSKGKADLLCRILDPYQRLKHFWEEDNNLLKSEEVSKLILECPEGSKAFLNDSMLKLQEVNRGLVLSENSIDQGMFINPMLHVLLLFALRNAPLYQSAIHEILDFGIDYNKKLLGFANEHFSAYANDLQVNEHGHIVIGLTRYSSMLTYDHAVDPAIDPSIKEKINYLTAQKNALLNLDHPGVTADTVTADGKYIWRKASENETEREMYKLCEKLEIHEVPKYHETREGLDRLDYISGYVVKHCRNATYSQIASLVRWLKNYQNKLETVLGAELDGRTYVHGALDPHAVVFENDEIRGIVNWQYCRIGERHEDFVSILVNWLDLGSSIRRNSEIFNTILKLLDEYDATRELRNNLPQLMKEEFDRKLRALDPNKEDYEYLYEYYRHAQTFPELYGERIKG